MIRHGQISESILVEKIQNIDRDISCFPLDENDIILQRSFSSVAYEVNIHIVE